MPLYLGLMSGTSLDGIDAALVELGGEEERPDGAELLHYRSTGYGPDFRGRLREATEGAGGDELCDLNFELGRRFSEAAREALGEAGVGASEVRAVGSHGQTVWHVPASEGEAGSTLQLGEPAVLAERLGTTVVADFRVRDVAAGGHGAPLSPYFDLLLLSHPRRSRAVQNLGGMGNVTALPPGSGPDGRRAAREGGGGGAARSPGGGPVAFDTGPGVALVDGAVERLTGGERTFDRDGEIAAAGEVREEALAEWLSDPFFREPPPRTTGRERFGRQRLERWLDRHGDASPEDLVATLTELTARSVAEAYEAVPFDLDEVLLCGGGARNPEIRRRLEEHLGSVPVRDLEAAGWDGDAREAACFALLARQHLLGVPVDLTWATGAAGPRVLGKRVPP